MHADVPDGADATDNVLLRQHGEPQPFDFEPQPHWELGAALGIIDIDRAAAMAGTRMYLLQGLAAALQRTLIGWFLDRHVQAGYTEIYCPAMVREEAMFVSGQLPKFRDNLYHDAEEDYWFVPTAEVPLTNLHRDEILDAAALPLRYAAQTPCFRREKMSAGRDVRGIKRVHQFEKVEMYQFTRPQESMAALDQMLAQAEALLRDLGLTYRVLQICSGDLGFTATLSYDLEVWAPARRSGWRSPPSPIAPTSRPDGPIFDSDPSPARLPSSCTPSTARASPCPGSSLPSSRPTRPPRAPSPSPRSSRSASPPSPASSLLEPGRSRTRGMTQEAPLGWKISSMGCSKSRAILKARGRLGSYFPVSICVDGLTRDPERLGELLLGPTAFGADDAQRVVHSQRRLAMRPPTIHSMPINGQT